jgi:hypothetical protein
VSSKQTLSLEPAPSQRGLASESLLGLCSDQCPFGNFPERVPGRVEGLHPGIKLSPILPDRARKNQVQ